MLVTASEELKIARFVERRSPGKWDDKIAEDARARLAMQIPDEKKIERADFVIENDGDLAALRRRVEEVWQQLLDLSRKT